MTDHTTNPTAQSSVPRFKELRRVACGMGKVIMKDLVPISGQYFTLSEEVVKDGTGAMRAYYEMMFGEHRNDATIKSQWREKLLRYCELDTMSMVIVWTHWMKLSSLL